MQFALHAAVAPGQVHGDADTGYGKVADALSSGIAARRGTGTAVALSGDVLGALRQT